MALSLEKEDDDIMNFPPRKTNETVFNKHMISEVGLAGITAGLLVFVSFSYLYNNGVSLAICRGCAMTLMVFIQNVHVLNCKNEYKSVLKISLTENKFMLVGIISAILLQIIVMEIKPLATIFQIDSIPISDILVLFLLSLNILIVMETFKYCKNKR